MHPLTTFDLIRLDQRERLDAALRTPRRPLGSGREPRPERPPSPQHVPTWFGGGLHTPLMGSLR